MNKEHKKQAEQFVKDINCACEPGKMTKPEALEFLEEILSDLEGNVEALKEEIGEDE